MPDISLLANQLQSVMFFFINIWYGIRIIRIYSGLLKLNMIMNQWLTIEIARFQDHFILYAGPFSVSMFRIILGYFKTFP
ncbi:hypothetical protein DOT37_13635 [Pantoea agglomerans]|nr:hypothetical protein DOT37_13635 [Pantoea agglomerans]